MSTNYQLYDYNHIISLFETFWYMSCNAAVNRTKQSPVICWYPQQCRLFSRVFTGFPMPSSKTTPSTGPYPECSGVIHEIYRNRNQRHLRRNVGCILNLRTFFIQHGKRWIPWLVVLNSTVEASRFPCIWWAKPTGSEPFATPLKVSTIPEASWASRETRYNHRCCIHMFGE